MNSDKYQYINLEAISEIADGDGEFIKEIIGNYLATVSDSIHGIDQAIRDCNSERIIFFAHKLKGSFGFVGAESLLQLAIYIEANAVQTELLKLKFLEMTVLAEKVAAELKIVLNDHDGGILIE